MDIGEPQDDDSELSHRLLKPTINSTKSSRWFPNLSRMVVIQYGCSHEIENLDQATSLSLQPCSLLSSIPPIVDYASKIKLI